MTRARANRRRRSALVAGLVAVVLAASVGCTADEPDPAPPPGPEPTGSAPAPSGGPPLVVPEGTNPFGAHWDWSRYDQFTPYLRKISGSATYHELTWCAMEKTKGQVDWAAVDRVAQRSRDLGITLNLKIRTGVCWATGGTAQHTRGQANKTESAMPLDMATYQAFVRSVVERYTPYGVTQFAVENEVNAPQYWSGTPEDYVTLVRAAAEAIHAAAPQAKVVDSGISSVAYGFGVVDRLVRAGDTDAAIRAYGAYFARRIGTRGQKIPEVRNAAALDRALANEANARNVAFLAATERLLDEGVVQVRQVHYYEHPGGVSALLDYLRAENPAGVPMEAWEVGQFWRDGDGDAASRAGEMTKVVTALLAGGIRQVMWLPLAYNPNNRAGSEVRYGLLDPDGAEREAGRIMEVLVAASRGATVTAVSRDAVTGVAFERAGATTLVLWSPAGTSASLPATPGLRAGPAGATATDATDTSISDNPIIVQGDRTAEQILATLR
ncbi:hypothetical protein [Polymorphospora sp. NPDC050346]|uniref:hypothetical protein n=1 Tax=Polymorphospora sp. NPDC050346 TaxID=3155780 RepID=UPI00340F3BE3